MIILQALYFMLPAYFANMAPVFATKIYGNIFSFPLDCNLKIKGKPLLGKNKTWRGLLAGVIMAIIVIYIQVYLYSFEIVQSLSILDYGHINILLFGFLFGFGDILGDAVKSLIKRQLNIKSGDRWFPWDQLDFLGGLLLIMFVFLPPWQIILIIIIISPLLPIIANWLAYKLKIKKVPW